MKQIGLVLLSVISMNALYAQSNIRQGDWMAGGSLSFSSSKYSGSSTSINNLNFSPDLGYFFINNFAGGVRVNVNYLKSGSGNTETKNTYQLYAPFVCYYFLPPTEKVNVFAEAGYGFGNSKSTFTNNITSATSTTTSASINGYDLRAGVAVSLVPAVALEIGADYNSLKYENITDRYHTIAGSLGFQIHLPGSRMRK